jgi:ubiquinone/menaquinone biosynthesis C-methylase UbiE
MARNLKEKFYPESRFGGFTDIDGTIAFYNRVNALIHPMDTVLDIGCGRGAFLEDSNTYRKNLRNLRGKVKEVIGIDVDPAGEGNPGIDSFKRIEAEGEWPIEEGSIDLAVSDWVLEHVSNPKLFFRECSRVLKAGGYLCMRTTNKWGYIAIGARVLPKSWQGRMIRQMQEGRKEEDIFPAYYRCNTRGEIKKMMRKYGFKGVVYGYDAEPRYFSNSFFGYAALRFYQSVCPSIIKSAFFIYVKK